MLMYVHGDIIKLIESNTYPKGPYAPRLSTTRLPLHRPQCPAAPRHPEHDHERSEQQSKQRPLDQLEELRYPRRGIIPIPVLIAVFSQQGEEADGHAKDEWEGHDGQNQRSYDLREEEPQPVPEAANLVRLLPPVEEHIPPDDLPLRLRDEPDGLHASLPQVVVDEDGLGDPGGEELDEDGDSRVAGQGVGELEQPNRACISASSMVQR